MSVNPSLYIHIPFCRKRCDYCDFYSSVPGGENIRSLMGRYVDRLIGQHRILSKEWETEGYRTIYLGGGTPSLLPPEELIRLMSEFTLERGEGEITMEVNPESLTEELLLACSESGINRISMGIQSLRPEILASMGRLAGKEENLRAVERLRRWEGTWSLDLIFAYPGQNGETQLGDLENFLALDPPHFSLYQLTMEEGTGLFEKWRKKQLALPDEEEMERTWEEALSLIEKAGFERYEISSFCRDGLYSRHNRTYWDRGSWIGLGAGAASLMGDRFRFTGGSWKDFLSVPETSLLSTGDFYGKETLDGKDVLVESVMMGLRTKWGLGRGRFSLLTGGRDPGDLFRRSLEKWKGRLILDGSGLRLNSRGLDWHSAVMVDLLLDLDKFFDYNTPL